MQLPHYATLSRYRFVLNAAQHILIRERLWKWIEEDEEMWIQLLGDSSPRSGREWLFSELFIILASSAVSFVDAMELLQGMREQFLNEEIEWDKKKARDLADVMHSCVWHCVLAPLCIGGSQHGPCSEACVGVACIAVGQLQLVNGKNIGKGSYQRMHRSTMSA